MMAGLKNKQGFLVFMAVVAVLVLALFRTGFEDGMVLYSSDGPLSTLKTAHNKMPDGFSGKWQDIYKLGKPAGAAPVNLTWLFLWVAGAEFFAKWYIPATLVFLGASIWTYMRSKGFQPWICAIAGVAGLLNSNFFSYGCWGLGTIVLSAGLFFLALASWSARERFGNYPSALICGLCLGLGVMEGFDVGIILAMLFAATCLWDIACDWFSGRKSDDPIPTSEITSTASRLAITIVFSILVAMQTVFSLFSTQVQGVSVLEEAPTSPQSRWDWATQWSLPVGEAVRIAIPGFFGYRMDTSDGGVYRGNVGRDPKFGSDTNARIPRHSGSGFYAGVPVLLLAIMAIIFALSKSKPFYNSDDRKWIKFWTLVGVLSLGFAFGRHFFLYGFIHPLPFFNSIRNPIKFLHPMTISVLILAAYGMKAFFMATFGKSNEADEKKSVSRSTARIMLGLPALAAVFFIIVAGQQNSLEAELMKTVARETTDQATAKMIPGFVVRETMMFVIIMAVSAIFIAMSLLGRFAKVSPTVIGAVLLTIVSADLIRANQPWIQHFNAGEKYKKDMLVEALTFDTPVAPGRVAISPQLNTGSTQLQGLMSVLEQLYRGEWIQHQFVYYDIPSIDIAQESRPAADFEAFRSAMPQGQNPQYLRRFWELTSTRYILGLSVGGMVEVFNSLDPDKNRFKLAKPFTIDEEKINRDNNVETLASEDGPFAIIEFEGALDRATLFHTWSSHTNHKEVLAKLGDLSWDPSETVFISPGSGMAVPTSQSAENPDASVTISGYKPTRMELKVSTKSPAVLMTTDKFDPDWIVTIDGKPAEIIRCNYIMRGVHLDGSDEPQSVVFEYIPPATPLHVTEIALIAGLAALGIGLTGWKPQRKPAVDKPGESKAQSGKNI